MAAAPAVPPPWPLLANATNIHAWRCFQSQPWENAQGLGLSV